MIDIGLIREHPAFVQERLAERGFEFDPAEVLGEDMAVRGLVTQLDEMRRHRNELSGQHGPRGDGATELSADEVADLKERGSALRDQIQAGEEELRVVRRSLSAAMLGIPNLPADHTPRGLNYEDFRLIYEWGEQPQLAKAVSHHDIGSRLGIIDVKAGVELAGPRFAVLRGKGAQLQRALVSYLLDCNIAHGYEEHTVPVLVNPRALEGTGQLPKFAGDVFSVAAGENGDQRMYLSPTTEVQLTNLARDRVFKPDELPMGLTAFTECFRSEAGSGGRDMKGIFRLHEFPKVELVRLSTAADSWASFEQLTSDAEDALRGLGLHYRKVALAAGDIAAQSAFTYDLEAWFPGQGAYREVSSCSNCTDYQGRNINARYVNPDSGNKEFVHTANGSSLAVGRTMAAILEQGLQPDGSVVIPEALRGYAKFAKIDR